MASVEEILDEVMSEVVQPSVVYRTADLEGKLEAQITICVEAFNKLDLGNNPDIFKANVWRQIKGSFQAFKPSTDPLKILLNVSLNCGSLFKTESELWLQKKFSAHRNSKY